MTVAVDWVKNAALDIQRIDTPTVVEICDVIESHLPFKKDIAYMPIPRCDTCKHWTHRGIRDYCGHPALRLRDSLLFVPPLETTGNFGCVQWEAK